jgi:hypothetical protein
VLVRIYMGGDCVPFKTLSSRQFSQAASRQEGGRQRPHPDHRPRASIACVALDQEIRKIRGRAQNIPDRYYNEQVPEIDFEPSRLSPNFIRPADFS